MPIQSTVRRAENLYRRTHSALSFSSFKSPVTAITNSSSHPKRNRPITLTLSLLLPIILVICGKLSINRSSGNLHPLTFLCFICFSYRQFCFLLDRQDSQTPSCHGCHFHCPFCSLSFTSMQRLKEISDSDPIPIPGS